MRHLRSILYALVLAPAVWILSGVGFTHDLTGRARDSGSVETVTGLLLLLLAGAAYGILLFAPISPAGPVAFGVVYLVVGVWALVGPSSYADLWPSAVAKPGFDLSLPGYGLAVLLAVPLICTALSARRWDRYEPPQIPLIGVLGRPRGAAQVSGTPVGAMHTEILTPYAADHSDATQVLRTPAGATTVLGSPEAADATQIVASAGSSDRTQLVGLSAESDRTQIVTPEAESDKTQVVGAPAEDEPTEAATPEKAADDTEPATEAVAEDDAEPATEAVAEDDAELVTVAVVEVTEVQVAGAVPAEVPDDEVEADDGDRTVTVASAEDGDETVIAAVAEDEPATEPVAEDEPATGSVTDDEPATQAVAEDEPELETEVVVLEGDKTELVALMEADELAVAAEPKADDELKTEPFTVADDDEPRTELLVLAQDQTIVAGPEDDDVEPETEAVESPAAEESVEDADEFATPDDEAAAADLTAVEMSEVEAAVAETVADAADEPEDAEEPEPATAAIDEPADDEPAIDEPAIEEPVVAQAESEAEETQTDEAEPASEPDEVPAEAALFEKMIPPDDQDRTQVIRLPAGELVTRDLRGRLNAAMPPPDERPTRVINRGAFSGADPGERTQVIRVPLKAEPPKPQPQPAESPKPEPAKPEPAKVRADDGERTQVIRLGAGTVEPPDDRTQVIRFSAEPRPTARTDEEPEEKTAPKGPSSVMGAERPNFAEDPTTRLMPPNHDEGGPAGNGNSRTMTVTNLERPADELADDLTRPLVPGQRDQESDA